MKTIYKKAIKEFFLKNNIKRIIFVGGDFALYYSHADVTEDGKLNVYTKGITTMPLDNFYLDFTLDYSALLHTMEHDLFLVQHHRQPTSLEFTFK